MDRSSGESEEIMKHNAIIFIGLVIIATCAVAIQAQTRPEVTDAGQITVGTDLVSVNVSVISRNGRSVSGLTRNQFEVFDDNVKQQLAFFSAEDSPAAIGIVYDMHPSTIERTTATLDSLRQFVKTLRPEDRFFIVAFNEYGSLVLDFIPTVDQVQLHLSPGSGSGPNSLYDAVFLAAGKLRESGLPKRALMVISDGLDHQSQKGYADIRERIRAFDVQIYSISWPGTTGGTEVSESDRWAFEDVTNQSGRRGFLSDGDEALGRAVLGELTRISGGTAYPPDPRGDRALVGICTQIAFELRRQYAIGFYPSDTDNGMKVHKVRIALRTEQKGLALSYRQAYRLTTKHGQ
jgi:VWFA-related protein